LRKSSKAMSPRRAVLCCAVRSGVEFALLNDSKQMSEEEREAVYEQLTTHPDVSYAV
jgi:ribonuclease HII